MQFKPILFSTLMVQAILRGQKKMTRRVFNNPYDHLGAIPCDFDEKEALVEVEFTKDLTTESGEVVSECKGDRKWIKCPYGQAGDILWVRESHCRYGKWIKNGLTARGSQKWRFLADTVFTEVRYFDNPPDKIERTFYRKTGWYKRSSIFMPREACRLFLKITDIRVERLQDITPSDACDEGVEYWNVDYSNNDELVADFMNYTWTEKKESDPNYQDRWFPTFANAIDSFRSLWQSINGPESWNANHWVWVISFERIIKPE